MHDYEGIFTISPFLMYFCNHVYEKSDYMGKFYRSYSIHNDPCIHNVFYIYVQNVYIMYFTYSLFFIPNSILSI